MKINKTYSIVARENLQVVNYSKAEKRGMIKLIKNINFREEYDIVYIFGYTVAFTLAGAGLGLLIQNDPNTGIFALFAIPASTIGSWYGIRKSLKAMNSKISELRYKHRLGYDRANGEFYTPDNKQR